jgi:hypothetical protein
MRTAATRLAVGTRLDARYKRKIDDLDGTVGKPYTNRTSRRSNRQNLRMLNRKGASVGQMNVESLKRPGLMESANLLNRHAIILTRARHAAIAVARSSRLLTPS